jgi:hypothetical protein
MKHSAPPPERFWASLPANDPRFQALRHELITAQGRGKQSPVARMLGEYALLGYLLTKGQIILANGANESSDSPLDPTLQDAIARNTAAMDEFMWE